MNFTVKIEQTCHQSKRMKYIDEYDRFEERNYDSISYKRKFMQPYGWIMESGTPPGKHLDAIVMTDNDYKLGEQIEVRVIGLFCRNDGDHKFVTVPVERTESDFLELSKKEQEDLRRLYPREDVGEGWFGKEKAEEIIVDYFSKKKKKTIITVQHTQSEHHVNGMVGAWGNWNLTDFGKKHAFEVGQWLQTEVRNNEFYMYVSDLNRATQTAEEMNKTLNLPMEKREIIREVNAGAGNGKPREWYNDNKIPKKEYDVDYKPFDDAESDRDLWERLYPFYQEIMENDKENIIIVSHGISLSFLKSMIMQYSLKDRRKVRLNGCAGSISKFNVDIYGKVTVSYINQQIFK